MKNYIEKLKSYDIEAEYEFFFILLNCIDENSSKFEDLIDIYSHYDNFDEIKHLYKEFYDYVLDYLRNININNELSLQYKILNLIEPLLEMDEERLDYILQNAIAKVVDLIFQKFDLNISKFKTNEEIKNYLLEKIKDKKIVDLLVVLLLAYTTLSELKIDSIPKEEFENVMRSLVLISLYTCKDNK